VGEKPVIAKRNAQSGRGGKKNKEADLKGVQSEVPDIGRDCDEGGQKRSDEKRAIYPVNSFPREVHLSIICAGSAETPGDR
jgi:hypothetical protein